MNPPSGTDVRSWLPQPARDWLEEAGFPEGTEGNDPLDRPATEATAELEVLTGQLIESPGLTGLSEQTVTTLIQSAIAGLTLQNIARQTPEYLDTLADFDLIQSFSAGPYTETRRNAVDAMKARQIALWPWLSNLLWNLMTPDKFDEWWSFFHGTNQPAWEGTEVDWLNRGGVVLPHQTGGAPWGA